MGPPEGWPATTPWTAEDNFTAVHPEVASILDGVGGIAFETHRDRRFLMRGSGEERHIVLMECRSQRHLRMFVPPSAFGKTFLQLGLAEQLQYRKSCAACKVSKRPTLYSGALQWPSHANPHAPAQRTASTAISGQKRQREKKALEPPVDAQPVQPVETAPPVASPAPSPVPEQRAQAIRGGLIPLARKRTPREPSARRFHVAAQTSGNAPPASDSIRDMLVEPWSDLHQGPCVVNIPHMKRAPWDGRYHLVQSLSDYARTKSNLWWEKCGSQVSLGRYEVPLDFTGPHDPTFDVPGDKKYKFSEVRLPGWPPSALLGPPSR